MKYPFSVIQVNSIKKTNESPPRLYGDKIDLCIYDMDT